MLKKEVESFILSTVKKYGRQDIMINNVGAGNRYADFVDYTIEEINEGIAINRLCRVR
jgi:NAD(P)-dependent dehydrogenase (short-subunit alcohol dehydrogenase family)